MTTRSAMIRVMILAVFLCMAAACGGGQEPAAPEEKSPAVVEPGAARVAEKCNGESPLFAHWDENGDGVLSAREFERYLDDTVTPSGAQNESLPGAGEADGEPLGGWEEILELAEEQVDSQPASESGGQVSPDPEAGKTEPPRGFLRIETPSRSYGESEPDNSGTEEIMAHVDADGDGVLTGDELAAAYGGGDRVGEPPAPGRRAASPNDWLEEEGGRRPGRLDPLSRERGGPPGPPGHGGDRDSSRARWEGAGGPRDGGRSGEKGLALLTRFEELDEDEDGVLDDIEFPGQSDMFERVDRNGDEEISMEEYFEAFRGAGRQRGRRGGMGRSRAY